MKRILLLFLCVLLASCAASINPVSPSRETLSNVNLNVENDKEIGSSLITISEVEKYKALRITNLPEKSLFSNKSYILNVGDVLPLLAISGDRELYFYKDNVKETKTLYKGTLYTTFSFYGLLKYKNHVKPFIRQTTGYLGGAVALAEKTLQTEPAEYISLNCENCFKKEFIYNGKSGNTIKFSYREYLEDLARPAYTQDLQYDLAESSVIGFKGLRIEVIKATNTNLVYKVIKSFD